MTLDGKTTGNIGQFFLVLVIVASPDRKTKIMDALQRRGQLPSRHLDVLLPFECAYVFTLNSRHTSGSRPEYGVILLFVPAGWSVLVEAQTSGSKITNTQK
jgi:hypothetical protein